MTTSSITSITDGQKKQLRRFMEDALEQSKLTKEQAQRVIERGGEFQDGIVQIITDLADPQPHFRYDKTADGWELLEDCGFTPALTSPKALELVPFLKGNETYVNGETMRTRARGELKANLGQCHAEWLLEHRADIPEEFRRFYLIFPGTVWRHARGNRYVPYLHWDDGRWFLNFDWLDFDDWSDDGRLVRPRE